MARTLEGKTPMRYRSGCKQRDGSIGHQRRILLRPLRRMAAGWGRCCHDRKRTTTMKRRTSIQRCESDRRKCAPVAPSPYSPVARRERWWVGSDGRKVATMLGDDGGGMWIGKANRRSEGCYLFEAERLESPRQGGRWIGGASWISSWRKCARRCSVILKFQTRRTRAD